jgi:cob(I)alamin adenosyltransferase
MVRLGKIYTRLGDDGDTHLAGGERIAKRSERVDAIGAVDELNSAIGLLRTLAMTDADEAIRNEADTTLRRIQNQLFDVGALLAKAGEKTRQITQSDSVFLETQLDLYQEILEPLTSFVLPGGSELNAHAHIARTTCRRTERTILRLHETEPVGAPIRMYVNRLSDFLFVFARWVARRRADPEFLWGDR